MRDQNIVSIFLFARALFQPLACTHSHTQAYTHYHPRPPNSTCARARLVSLLCVHLANIDVVNPTLCRRPPLTAALLPRLARACVCYIQRGISRHRESPFCSPLSPTPARSLPVSLALSVHEEENKTYWI